MIFGGHDVLVRVIRNLKIIMAYLSCSLAGVSLFSACNSREKITEVTVSPVVKEIDDSIHAGSAHSAELIDRRLSEAGDSDLYYEIYLRKLRLQATTGNMSPDSMEWERMASYLERRKPTPHINNVKASFYNIMGFSYHKYQLNPRVTLDFYGKAYEALQNSESNSSMPDICANIGDIYIDMSDMPMAAQWYRRALFLSDSLRLPETNRLTLLTGLARICQNIGDYESAKTNFDKVHGHIDDLAPNMQIYFLNNYGNFLYYTKDYPAAEKIFLRLKEMLEENGLDDGMDMMVCRINLADVYLNLRERSKAIENLEKAEAYFKATGNDTGIYYANTIRIGLALLANDTETARKVIDNENITSPIDFNLVNIRHRYLTEYYEKRGDYKKAFDALKAQEAHNESLQHNITHMRTSDIMMRYSQDTLALHHAIAMKEKDVVIKQARWMIYASILTIGLLTIMSLYIITLLRKRRLQADMQLMNIKLSSIRNLISPHFIFNILNHTVAKTDTRDSGELISLIRLIRENIKMSGHLYVTLKEEMDFVNSYIEVIKFNMQLTVTEQLPDNSYLDCHLIPSTFIQTLVENAIKHGFSEKNDDNRLEINVTTSNDFYTVRVTDNGRGFDIRRSQATDGGTGLKVIRNTIAILNRENRQKISFLISNITDDNGNIKGCEAILTIPVTLKDRHNRDN